jgi:hypothetical protein
MLVNGINLGIQDSLVPFILDFTDIVHINIVDIVIIIILFLQVY